MWSNQGGLDADVVVVGAGIVGAWTAYLLARGGSAVVVVDPASGTTASLGNAGMLVPSYSIPMSNPAVLWSGVRALMSPSGSVSLAAPMSSATAAWMARFVWQSRPGRARRDAVKLCRLAQRSSVMYRDLAAGEGVDLGLRPTGWLYTARSAKARAAQCRTARFLKDLGVKSHVLDVAGVRALEGGLGDDIAGGVFFPDDSALNPAAATSAVLQAAVAHGATVVNDHAERSVVDPQSGDVTVPLRTGRSIRATTIVLAVGSATSTTAEEWGLKVPRIEPGYGWSLTLPTDKQLTTTSLVSIEDHVVVNSGREWVRITGGMRFGGSPDSARPADYAALRSAAERLVPAIAAIDDSGTEWSGARPMTASGIPVTEFVDDHHMVAAGHGTLGMTLAPATAELVVSALRSRSMPGERA